MKQVYLSSGVLTSDVVSIVIGIILGLVAGIGLESVFVGIFISLIMPTVILSNHLYLVKALKVKK